MRKGLFLLLFLCIGLLLYAQEPIRFDDREVYLEPNVRSNLRAANTSSLELGVPTGAKLNVLVQFEAGEHPNEILSQKGVVLGDYLGSNAYWAEVAPGSSPSDFIGTGLRTISAIRAEWKVPRSFLQQESPEWAKAGEKLQMSLTWFPTVDWIKVRSLLEAKIITYRPPTLFARSVEVEGTYEQLRSLASAEWVAMLTWVKPPQQITNRDAAKLSGAAVLQMPVALGGRELLGDGIRVGVWDANVAQHVDYGQRIHVKEFEIGLAVSGGHGMHTTGTIASSGLLNERARGMAPHANVWTWNFNIQSNGKTAAQEMYETFENEQISLTSNSYGLKMSEVCNVQEYLNYTALGDPSLDELAYYVPTLTHVFAAGNDQGACKQPFGHATSYGKNIISVAAVDSYGKISEFSSFGPLRDGRLFPIVSARGVAVYSTIPNQSYKSEDGTSMACPAVTGHLALLTQRWKQLHGNVNPYNYFLKALIANTATDAGNIGPDYKYGFGIVDAVAAVIAMEKEWYRFDFIAQNSSDTKEHTVRVPAGTKELRAMICWNDPVANKHYKAGELPMVNDLDVVVKHAGKTYYPYSLSPQQPEANAVATTPNRVDNIEQVVIRDPQPGEYTISVSGAVHQGKRQSYALVWYFEDYKPTLQSPLAGEVYAPGENVYLRAQHFAETFTVELSTDGGNTYTQLGEGSAYCTVKIPANTKSTAKAKFRLTDKTGHILIMNGEFRIMPQVQNLILNDKACSTEGWLLQWDAVENAAKYKILKADLEKETYDEIAEVQGTQNRYVIPKDKVSPSAKNIFSVQAVSAEGVGGRRSIGVLATKAIPITITEANLPYRETFIELPLQNATIATGKNLGMKTQDAPAYLGLPLGSQMLVWQATTQEKNWDKPFERRDNVGVLEICGLDLTKYTANEQLFFRTRITMTPNINTPGALLRLLVNGAEEKDVLAREQIEGDGDEHDVVWEISKYKGQNIRLALEFALETQSDAFILVNYQVEKASTMQDVGIAWVNRPVITAHEQLGVEKIQFKIANNGYTPVTNIPVSIQVDGRVVYTGIVEKLKPYEDKIISFNYDFSHSEPHKFVVEARVDVTNDAHPENNSKRFEVYNMGDVLRMPEVAYYSFLGVRFPHVPYISKKLNGTQLFVDGGGSLAPYKQEEQAILQILPRDSNNVVQATFYNVALAKDDTLSVYVSDVPANLKVQAKDATFHLTEQKHVGKVFVSEADNGGLTFRMTGYNDHPGEGWIAEVREVAQSNQWRIKGLREVASSETNKSNVEVTIENLHPASYYNVGLTMYVKDDTLRYQVSELLPSRETKFVIPHLIDITPPMRSDLRVVLARDGDRSDNVANLSISHDKEWNGGTIQKPEQLWISSISTPGGENLSLRASNSVYYVPETLTLYKESLNAVQLGFAGSVQAQHLPAQVQIWIDANDDQLFDDQSERYTFPLKEGDFEYWADLDLSKLTNIAEGVHRMRVMLSSPDGYTQFKAKGAIEWGHVVDLKSNIMAGKSPYERELGITGIEGLETKRGLGAEELIQFRVQNNGLTAVTKLKARYKINDRPEVEEEFVCDLQPHSFDTQLLTFSQKADLSTVGKHDILVELTATDGNALNNSSAKTIYNIAEKTADLYALRFVGNTNESVQLPWIGLDVNMEATIEGLWKLDGSQRCDLVNSEGLWIASYVGEREIADNTLVVKVGEGGGFASLYPVLQPGKWQHIAVTLHKEGLKDFQTTTLKVYIDGEEVPMRKVSNSGFGFDDILLNVGLKGENAMCRVWNTVRTQEEIAANMLRSVCNASFELPANCQGEFLFTEGRGTVTAYDNQKHGIIQSNRTDIWQKIEEVVSDVEADGQVIAAKRSAANEFTITMPDNFSQLNAVKLNFTLGWAGAKLYYGGREVQPMQSFDFSNPAQTLSFKAKKEGLFGKTIEQNFTIKLVKELSAACDLIKLTVDKTKNPGLKETIVVNTPDELIELRAADESATSKLDPSKVVLTVDAVAPNAKLYLGEELKPVPNDVTVDLRKPVLLVVRAANGRNERRYVLRLAYEQTITWETAKIALKYTRQPLSLGAKASSGLPIVYKSEDPKIVTIDEAGNLLTCGVGKTKIYVTQPGDELYLPATPIAREVEITRIPLTITMQDAVMEAGASLPELVLQYEGLQFEGSEPLFETEYRIMLPDNTTWLPNKLPLVPGTYRVEPKEKGPVPIDGYMVTRKEGKLIVNPAQAATLVTFTITDEKGNALDGVTLRYGYVSGVVSNGYELPLQSGNYTVSLSKAGYTSFEQEVAVSGAAIEVKATLLKKAHHLQYVAGANGCLQGMVSQYVADGEDGETVVAVPTQITYRFKQWSDGNLDAARTDKDVQSDLMVTAEFETFECHLTYQLTAGGICTTNNLSQTLNPGTDAEPVEVEASEGYVFVGWSDGVTAKRRTDKNVLNDLSVTALFERAHRLKWAEDFELGESQLNDWSFAKPFEGRGWLFSPVSALPEVMTPRGNFLLVDPRQDNAQPWYADLWAKTPWFSLTDRVATSDVTISYMRYFKSDFSEGHPVEVYLEYCFEDGAWQRAHAVTESYGEVATFTLTADKMAGHNALRFRWNITAKSYKIYLAIDNIEVKYTPEVTDLMLRYIAGEHGRVKEQAKTESYPYLELHAPAGGEGVAVEAMPDAGYIFAGWSDKITTAVRKDKKEITVKALFAPAPKTTYELVYTAGANGIIEGQSYQVVREGEMSSPVRATPLTGYKFSHWSDERTENPRTDLATSNMRYEAFFVKSTAYHKVILEVEGEGELKVVDYTPEMLKRVAEGTLLTVEATPKDATRWKLKTLTANGEDILASKSFRVMTNVVVKATFEDMGTDVVAPVFAHVVVAPNPFDKQLRIMSGDLLGHYALLNAQGVVLTSGVLEVGETLINTTALPAGIYLLRLTSDNGEIKTEMLVKD